MRSLRQFTYTLLLAVVIFSGQTLWAQKYFDDRVDRTKYMYNEAMTSDVEGLIESAIYNVLVLKYLYPQEDYSELVKTIDELSLSGKTIQIRYKAQLAGFYLKNPDMFTDIQLKSVDDPSPYFRILSERVEKVAFSTAAISLPVNN